AAQPASTGNYELTVWEAEERHHSLVLNERTLGQLDSPFAIDHWHFTSAAGKQVRLLSEHSEGVVFTLRGPGGWVAFEQLAGDSPPVTLEANGEYTLSAVGV